MRTEILVFANDSTAEVELPLESIADKTVGDIASKDLKTRSHQKIFPTNKLKIMAKKPIKRNKNIVSLSRDHHHGLLLCWKIRQGLKLNVELKRIGNYIHFFWKTQMVEHFRKEEELLFSKIDGPVCDQVKDEHGIMRLLVDGIDRPDKNNRNSYIEFSNLLEQHIRYEERVLFPYLEANISASQLEAIGKELEMNEAHNDVYEDEFWLQREIVISG